MRRLLIYFGYYLFNILYGVDVAVFYCTLPLALLCFLEVATIRERYFTLRDMFWFLTYLFFVIAPLQRIENGTLMGGPVDGYVVTNPDLMVASAIPFIFAAVISVASRLLPPSQKPEIDYVVPGRRMPILTLTMVALFIIYVAMSGVGNLFLSRYEKGEAELAGASFFYAAQIVTAAISATIIRAMIVRNIRGKAPYLIQFAIILACLALTANPVNSARYFVLAAWLPLFLILFGGKVGATKIYAALGVALIFVMPIMSITTRFGLEGLADIEGFSQNAFRIPFLDVFDLLCYEINFIGQNGFYWGQKTLGILLFFVPRVFWEGKPSLLALDMGDLLVSLKMAGTDNLSMFVGGEFYADAGLFGVFFLTVALSGLLIGVASRRLFTVNGMALPVLVFMAALPILLRGPLAANLLLTVSQYVFMFAIVPLIARPSQTVTRARSRRLRLRRNQLKLIKRN